MRLQVCMHVLCCLGKISALRCIDSQGSWEQCTQLYVVRGMSEHT
jgi:hypothetical protein